MKRLLVILMAIFVYSTGCKKDDSPDPAPVTTTTPTLTTQQILLSHSWKLTTHHTTVLLDTDGDGIMEVIRFTDLDTCISNAIRTFQLNNYFKSTYPATCTSYHPDSVTWQLTPDGSVLTLGTRSFNIFGITGSELKIAIFEQDLNPQVFSFDTLFYTH